MGTRAAGIHSQLGCSRGQGAHQGRPYGNGGRRPQEWPRYPKETMHLGTVSDAWDFTPALTLPLKGEGILNKLCKSYLVHP